MLIRVLHQRNEAWFEERTLREELRDMEHQLLNAEAYNAELHEEVHRLYN